MDFHYIYQHILGSLSNALIGDAMGSATETMTPKEIEERYGGKVKKFYPPPEGTFAFGRKAGQLTDDTTQMLMMAQIYLENKGKISIELVVDKLLDWAKNEELFGRFAGPSTRKAINLLKEGKSPFESGIPEKMGMGISDGAAMKIAPAGLMHPGNLDAAVQDAIALCIPTHNADVAFAGAAATAAGIAAALQENATELTVVDATIYGAKKGYEIGAQKSIMLHSPSMVNRIYAAVEIALKKHDFFHTCEEIVMEVGCGLPLLEAVPFAIGTFVAARGDPNLALIGAVNMGGDADTTATIVGSLSGAYAGIERVDDSLYQEIIRVNDLDLQKMSQDMAKVIFKRDFGESIK